MRTPSDMNNMAWQFILSSLYFFLPAYFCNMTPPLSKRAGILRFLDKPIDSGKYLFGQPLLGSHKTWRGAVLGIAVGMATAAIQLWLYQFPFFKGLSPIDYKGIDILSFGFLISAGAVFGDLFFAAIKRRLKLKPGSPFLPWDQTNYVIGAFIFLEPFLRVSILAWLTIFISTFFLHIIVNRAGYYLGLHKAKW